jgi:hypothetical protein
MGKYYRFLCCDGKGRKTPKNLIHKILTNPMGIKENARKNMCGMRNWRTSLAKPYKLSSWTAR